MKRSTVARRVGQVAVDAPEGGAVAPARRAQLARARRGRPRPRRRGCGSRSRPPPGRPRAPARRRRTGPPRRVTCVTSSVSPMRSGNGRDQQQAGGHQQRRAGSAPTLSPKMPDSAPQNAEPMRERAQRAQRVHGQRARAHPRRHAGLRGGVEGGHHRHPRRAAQAQGQVDQRRPVRRRPPPASRRQRPRSRRHHAFEPETRAQRGRSPARRPPRRRPCSPSAGRSPAAPRPSWRWPITGSSAHSAEPAPL